MCFYFLRHLLGGSKRENLKRYRRIKKQRLDYSYSLSHIFLPPPPLHPPSAAELHHFNPSLVLVLYIVKLNVKPHAVCIVCYSYDSVCTCLQV